VQVLARLEVAGGPHAVKVPMPVADFGAHTKHPEATPESSKKTILPVEKPAPKLAGGGAPKTPTEGDGSGKAFTGMERTRRMRGRRFRCIHRGRL
jgi:hypothetical protein